MPPQEQADLWMSLRDRMKVDWKEMTMQEKKAGAYSLFGRNSVLCAVAWGVGLLVDGARVVPQHHYTSCGAITNHFKVIDKDDVLTIHCLIAYYIAFGPHGPRRPPPPDEGRNVFFLSAGVIAAAFAVFAFSRMFASPIRPRTMTKEWQEASEEYLKVCSENIAIAVNVSSQNSH
jgi:hypothetical protein